MDQQTENTMYQDNQISTPVEPMPEQSPNHMATASLVMGILAVVTCCCYFVAFIFGGLGIIFALLSRTDEKMCGQAKAGLILSIVGFVIVALLWVGVWFLAADNAAGRGPIRNLPAVPEFTKPDLDNILTAFRSIKLGGGIR